MGWLKTQQPLPFSTVEEKRNITNALRFIDEATLKLDYLAVARLTHPKILHANGGEEKYATVIATILATTKAQGMVFVSHEIKEPHDPFVAGDLVVCFVPEMTTMTQKGKTISISRAPNIRWSLDVCRRWRVGSKSIDAFGPCSRNTKRLQITTV